jgi:hypothetical protein
VIAPAIYSLLNVSSVTDLVTGIYFTTAPQLKAFPYITFDESGTTENFKDGCSIINHRLQVDIYCSKGKDGNGGFSEASTIADAVQTVLDRQKGTFASINIDQIYLEWQQALYDPMSEAARVILEYNVRQRL